MRGRLLLVGLWLLATVAIITALWVTVFSVVFDVGDRPTALFIPTRASANLDERSGRSQAGVLTPEQTSAPLPSPTTTTAPVARSSSQPPSLVSPVPSRPGVGTPSTSSSPGTGPSSSSTGTRTTVQGARLTEASVGGQVTVVCQGSAVSIYSATPSVGFTTIVHSAGPEEVDVSFVSSGHESEVVAHCVAGTPTAKVTETS